MSRPPTVLRRPATPFSRLARVQAASLAGDGFVTVALAGSLFFAVPLEAARPKVALYLLITMAPFALVAPFVGPLLDRAKSRRGLVAVGSCLGRAVLCLLLARHLGGLLFYPEAFGVLVLIKAYMVVKSALVPTVVTTERGLVEANARLAVTGVVGGALGGGMAAGILWLGGSVWVLIVGAMVYVAAAVFALRMVRAGGYASDPPEAVLKPLPRVVGLRAAAVGMGALRWGVGFLIFLLAFAFKRADEPAWIYGTVVAASAGGGFVGAVLAPRLRRLVKEEAILAGSMVLPAGAAVIAARGYGIPVAVLAAAVLGLAAAAGKAGFDSLVQRDAPDTVWGRSFARFEAYFQLAWVAGAAVPVLVALGAATGLLILAYALGGAGFLYLAALSADRLLGEERGSA